MPYCVLRTVPGVGFIPILIVMVLAMLGSGGGAAVVSANDSGPVDEAAGDVVLKQIAALRVHDFAGAYAMVSAEMRRNFSRGEFEWMMKRAHPEIANSVYAFVVRTHEAGGFLYVTAKVHGKNGKNVEALYEVVREAGALKVNALSCRHDDGVL